MRFEHEATPIGVDERVAQAPGVDLLARIVTARPAWHDVAVLAAHHAKKGGGGVCAGQAQRGSSESHRIAKELRRMKQEELEEFKRFEAVYGKSCWEEVLKARREAEGNPHWRPLGWRASVIKPK